jgi:glycosyltransferase involved in cell wall biosynthesis
MPKVSVGLPVFNGEQYIRESIECILDQTLTDLELILVDNASTDRTPEICQEYVRRDPRVRYFRQERNVGLARNSNRALELSTGQYFKWTTHDDLHGRDFLAKCVEVLDRDPSVVLCCTTGVLVDAEAKQIDILHDDDGTFVLDRDGTRIAFRAMDPPRKLSSYNPADRFRDILLHTAWCLEIFGVMRSDVLRSTRLQGGYIGTDKRVLAEMSLRGRFVEVPEVALFYRQYPAQAKRYQASAASKDVYVGGAVTWRSYVPRLNNFLGFWTAVTQAPLSVGQKLGCYLAVLSWSVQLRRWPAMAAEAFDNMRAALKSTLHIERRAL